MKSAKILCISLIAIICIAIPTVNADLVQTNITAEVTGVYDPGSLLEGNVNVGDPVTGYYMYDTDTPDSSPLDPVQGNYWHKSTPYGISLSTGGFNFQSNPSNIDYFLFIRNNTSLGNDIYGFDSYNNSDLSDGIHVNLIGWVLKDYSGNALVNDKLLFTVPELNDWNDENVLVISGGLAGELHGTGFGIEAFVTSATRAPEPSTLILLSLGFLSVRRRK